jgi:hypothetical protein
MAAFPDTAWFNDRSSAQYKLLVADPKGFLDPPSRIDHLVAIPGRMGHLRVSKEDETGPRRFTVEAVLRATSQSEADALWDRLMLVVMGEEVEVRFAAWPTLVGRARYEGLDVTGQRPRNAKKFTMSFLMADPLKYAKEMDVYTIQSGATVTLELGSAASDVEVRLIGTAAADPGVYYRDAQGTVRGFIGYVKPAATGGLSHLSWIEVNSGLGVTTLHGSYVLPALSGVLENAGPSLNSDSIFFTASPFDGDGTTGPTLQAINCRAVAYVRRAWA